jgi:hypothetical protein
MITKDNEPIYLQADGNYTIQVNGQPYGVCDNNPAEQYTKKMVEDYLTDNHIEAIPEPQLPAPTPEQLAAAEASQAQGEIDELERKALRPLLAIARGQGTKEDEARIEELGALIDPLAAKVRRKGAKA